MNYLVAIITICSMLIFPVICMGQEIQAEQEIKNNQTYFTGNLEKMPENQNGKEKITNHFSFFTANIIINGKTEYKGVTKSEGVRN